ncbi:MAG: rod shape-determining protein RodA [Sphingobacteriales bacterium]|nr:rod shape-determining protein RodA [Sphingobacteriales bacterium]MBI3719317.1 rod shape-determining protein RodA [Sphingobacteriales bacterium]
MNDTRQGISKGIDTTILWLYFALVTIGWIAIFSVEYRSGDNAMQKILSFNTNYAKQLFFIGLSLVVGVFVLLTDSKFFTATANIFYAFGIVTLLLVFPFHSHIKGTNSIIKIGAFNFQPAEICKLFVALALAKYLSRLETNFNKTNSHLVAFAITLTPSILAIFQNETGLALVYFSFFIVMYREGLPAWYLILGFTLIVLVVATLLVDKNVLAIILTAIAVFVIYLLYSRFRRYRRFTFLVVGIWLLAVSIQRFAVPYVFDHVMQPYQVKRIYAAIGKDYVPKDAQQLKELQEKEKGKKGKDESDYNVKQSKIAIGSGGLLGKGFLKGLQTQGDFVPEQHTDFIFTAWAESFGFWGSFLLLGLYLFLLLRIVNIAERQRSAFSRVYAYSVASIIFFHVMVNICMTVGLAPVIGIPLPMLSYGGSSLLTFTILIFILLRLDADRQMVLR